MLMHDAERAHTLLRLPPLAPTSRSISTRRRWQISAARDFFFEEARSSHLRSPLHARAWAKTLHVDDTCGVRRCVELARQEGASGDERAIGTSCARAAGIRSATVLLPCEARRSSIRRHRRPAAAEGGPAGAAARRFRGAPCESPTEFAAVDDDDDDRRVGKGSWPGTPSGKCARAGTREAKRAAISVAPGVRTSSRRTTSRVLASR